ncbi:MAG: hypothetical protein FJZ87_06760 [Chloroflexi bacterium]|nr:hypothetical protein [Chloroflexota bacterium]
MESDSTKSILNDLRGRDLLFIFGSIALVFSCYLLVSRITAGIGFPLDDSWIHQIYARNLAEKGEWAFRPGVLSAGSTSPLWSALLSVGYWLGIPKFIWTFSLAGGILLILSCLCEWIVRREVPSYHPKYPWVGLIISSEWHLVWAGLSGMETLLHALLATSVLALLVVNFRNYVIIGILAGISIWARPDGLTLLGPILLVIFYSLVQDPKEWPLFGRFLIGFMTFFGLYLYFNLMVGGTPMPNTFYAKQAEYLSWRNVPIITRIGRMLLQLLAGTGLVLLPGVIYWLVTTIKRKRISYLAIILWLAGYFGLYVLRLPVYQHGRYFMPAMPGMFLLGLLGMMEFVGKPATSALQRRLKIAWISGTIAIVLAFVLLGARAYSQDVRLIETEMVASAKWVAVELPPGSLIAAHDIGALGFFDNHAIVDLAGLISPEVIPFIRDEDRLREYLNQKGVDYLIVMPGFYQELTDGLSIVYSSKESGGGVLDGRSMTVYQWEKP